MNDTSNDFATYLMLGERVIWQGRNTKTKQGSLLKSMVPALLGMAVALAAAYYIVFVLSPDMVLNIGFGIDTKLGTFLIVLLVFAPFLMRPLWQRQKSKSIALFGVELPAIALVLLLTTIILLAVVLLTSMPFALFLLLLWSTSIIIIAESQPEQNATYVVTNFSALIVPAGAASSKQVTIVPFKNLTEIRVVENNDGSGTLMFGTPADATNQVRANSTLAFWNIEKPWEVYRLIRNQMTEQTISS